MNKNVIVLDESGNEIGATYFKRARGLVKKGRARFVSESSIRLTPMPENQMEGDKMSEENKTEKIEETAAAFESAEEMAQKRMTTQGDAGTEKSVPAGDSADKAAAQENRDTAEYCLKQIEEIRAQTDCLEQAIAGIHALADADNDKDAATISELAHALSDMICCRETTNQQLITFYEKMYDDRKAISERELLDVKRSMTEKSLETIGVIGQYGHSEQQTTDLFNSVQDTIRRLGI